MMLPLTRSKNVVMRCADYEGDTHNLGTPKFVVKFNRANYENMRDTWKNYWTWKNNRNAARGTLEEQFGYDTKLLLS